MASGIRLKLSVGPAVAVPAPREVMEALESVQVTVSDQTSAFELRFTLDRRSPLHTLFLLGGGVPIPLLRVIVQVSVFGQDHILIDGVMTRHEVSGGSATGPPTLVVQGEDLARVMDYIDVTGVPYPALPVPARVQMILVKYMVLGVMPLVIPPVVIDAPVPTRSIPMHVGTDLRYIRKMAREAGHVFYLDPGPAPGMSVAYWGPAIKVGVPQPALNVDMDSHTNVESLQFSVDTESAATPVLFVQNELTRVPIPIPVPDISPLAPPLGAVAPLRKRLERMPETAALPPTRAALVGISRAAATAEAVSAQGALSVLRYGRILKARQLVGVRGAGPAFDGLYYVKSTTHEIKAGEHKQRFTLTRNGLLSTVPRVVP